MRDLASRGLEQQKALAAALSKAESEGSDLVAYFGADSQKTEITEFFKLFSSFLSSYQSAEKSVWARESKARVRSRRAQDKTSFNPQRANHRPAPKRGSTTKTAGSGGQGGGVRDVMAGLKQKRKEVRQQAPHAEEQLP
jgi:hypothetical protein